MARRVPRLRLDVHARHLHIAADLHWVSTAPETTGARHELPHCIWPSYYCRKSTRLRRIRHCPALQIQRRLDLSVCRPP
jgi:hypothetical protein